MDHNRTINQISGIMAKTKTFFRGKKNATDPQNNNILSAIQQEGPPGESNEVQQNQLISNSAQRTQNYSHQPKPQFGNVDQSKRQDNNAQQEIINQIKKRAEFNYHYGDFSRYAYRKQVELAQYEEIINKVIEQALQSHLKQLKNIAQIQNDLAEKSKQNFEEVKNMLSLEKQSEFKQFLTNPVQFYISKTIHQSNIENNLKQFIVAVLKANEYIYIQNKLINKKQLNVNEYLQEQSNIYVPMKNYENLYIKDSTQSFNLSIQGNLFQKQQLKKLSIPERTKIIESVKMFLKENKILVKEDTIDQRIKQILMTKQKNE